MTLTYSDWTEAGEAPPPQAAFSMRPAHDLHHLKLSPRDRILSAAATAGGQILIAGLLVFASWNAVKPAPETQTITVSITATEAAKPVEPPPRLAQLPNVPATLPQIAPPQIEISAPPPPMAIQAAPPAPPPQPQQKVVEEEPVSPPRFDAAYLNNPAPAYPNMSRRLREVGVVQLRVRVSAAGLPLEVQMAKSSGYARLDESAMAAIQKWKFQAAMRNGNAVEAWVLVPIEFSLTRG